MANKVLSIKMDEKDIERLKRCYEALAEAGFLSSKSMSLNAFYKHLLLDYMEEDVHRAFETFSNYGMLPSCINPEEVDRNEGIPIANIYNLQEDSFAIYKRCVKDVLNDRIERMNKNVEVFNEVVNAEIILTEGELYKMDYIPCRNMDEECDSFWENKVFEILELQKKEYKEKGMWGEFEMIENSSIPKGLKRKLIKEIEEYDKQRKQNYSITHGVKL